MTALEAAGVVLLKVVTTATFITKALKTLDSLAFVHVTLATH